MHDSAISGTGPILAPIELSDFSPTVLLTAAEEAALRGTDLVVLHVVHDPAQSPGYYARALARAGLVVDPGRFRQLEEVANEVFDALLESMNDQLTARLGQGRIERKVVLGVPAPRIVEVADALGARMIVMGSHGHTGFAHILLGSVAARVVRLSQTPVLIVRHPGHVVDGEA